MPRDVFIRDPDGHVVLQAWVSFAGRDESMLTRGELDRALTWEELRQLELAAKEHEAERTRLTG